VTATRPAAPWVPRAVLAVVVVVNLVILFWPRAPSETAVPGLDKVVHLATFGSLAFAGLWAGLTARWWLPLLGVHAVTSELVQAYLLPHRDGDVRDVLADLAGVVAGAVLARASWGSDGSRARRHPDRAAAGGDTRPG
jgi:VanZ family protein